MGYGFLHLNSYNTFVQNDSGLGLLLLSWKFSKQTPNAFHLTWMKGTQAHVTCTCFTHWGRVTHICVSKLTIIGSDNGLSPGRRQAIIWTNAGILSTGPLGTNVSEILIEIYIFSFKKMQLKMPSGKWRPSCLGLNVLKGYLCGCHQNIPG